MTIHMHCHILMLVFDEGFSNRAMGNLAPFYHLGLLVGFLYFPTAIFYHIRLII